MKHSIVLLIFFFEITSLVFSQSGKFRSGIFLHHSTGGCIWGPNDSNTSVPQEMAKYSTSHGLSGDNAISMNEQWWPSDDNEWATWHNIFDNRDPSNDIQPIIQNNRIIVIKSCFPCSNIDAVGSPSDTLDPTYKTIYNYKWHWRSIVKVMASRLDRFFVIWTNAPLVANDTDDQQARLSDQFCYWAKDTLANGADPVFGAFPPNVYVFDFFHKLAGSNGKLPLQYAAGAWDSHPNAAATEKVAPQFVTEIFDAAIEYEGVFSGIQPVDSHLPLSFFLEQNYPNPFNAETIIKFQLPTASWVSLSIFDVLGRKVATLVEAELRPGEHRVVYKAQNLASGLYIYQLRAGSFMQQRKLILIR